MPLTFTFRAPDKLPFRCRVQCRQCTARATGGRRCRRRVAIAGPLCCVHRAKRLGLAVRASPLGGRGLFALRPFQPGATVCEYTGERVDDRTLERRYGRWTAPYALRPSRGLAIDAACLRGVGSLANHAPAREANAAYREGPPGRVFIVATRPIPPGTEILVDYGREYRLHEPTRHITAARS